MILDNFIVERVIGLVDGAEHNAASLSVSVLTTENPAPNRCMNHWRLPNPLRQCHRGQPSLPIAVNSHIDDVCDSLNDGITSRRIKSGIRFVFQLMTWSKDTW